MTHREIGKRRRRGLTRRQRREANRKALRALDAGIRWIERNARKFATRMGQVRAQYTTTPRPSR